MERKAFMCDMIRTELEDIVGVERSSFETSTAMYWLFCFTNRKLAISFSEIGRAHV